MFPAPILSPGTILVPQATRLTYGTTVSSGDYQAMTVRQFHTCVGGFERIRLLFMVSQGVLGTVSPTTFEASVETGDFVSDPTGATTKKTRVTFGGSNTVTLGVNDFIWSDPVSVKVAANTKFSARVYASVATLGQLWSTGTISTGAYAPAFDYAWGSSASNTVMSGAMTNTLGVVACPGLIGIAAIEPAGSKPVVVVIGDSIAAGATENGTQNDPYAFPDRAFGPSRSSFSMLRLAFPTMPAFAWAYPYVGEQQRYMQAVMDSINPTHVICQFGINDLAGGDGTLTLQDMKDRLHPIWAQQRAKGRKIYQTTITPYADSTDNWQTLGNQTPLCPGTQEATRTALNDYIRTSPSLIDGYFELADVCESSRNSGKWKVDGTPYFSTADRIHPIGPILHEPMGLAIDPARFKV